MALTREKILDTAFTVLSQYGLADLSMRRLAAELGVAPGALYYHIKNKQDLLSHLASRLLVDVPVSSPTPVSVDEKVTAVVDASARVYEKLVGIREGAEVVRLALALHPQRLVFLTDLDAVFGEQVPGAADASDPALAAKTVLHCMLSLIEEEQTRALVTAAELSTVAPAYYALSIEAVARGFLVSHSL
nr:TetR/AcrR family transcriptional regulator [Rothia sp. ZJ1223]